MSNMMQGWYVPTTEDVCNGFHGDPRKFDQAGELIDAIGSNYGSKCYAAFHRWLAVMEAAFDAAIDDREDDGIGAMGIALKALAESRERES